MAAFDHLATFKGRRDPKNHKFAFIKDRCVGCNRVVYAYVELDVPLDPPRCSTCKEKG